MKYCIREWNSGEYLKFGLTYKAAEEWLEKNDWTESQFRTDDGSTNGAPGEWGLWEKDNRKCEIIPDYF